MSWMSFSMTKCANNFSSLRPKKKKQFTIQLNLRCALHRHRKHMSQLMAWTVCLSSSSYFCFLILCSLLFTVYCVCQHRNQNNFVYIKSSHESCTFLHVFVDVCTKHSQINNTRMRMMIWSPFFFSSFMFLFCSFCKKKKICF